VASERAVMLELTIEPQRLLRHHLATLGECAPIPIHWPAEEQNVLPASYLTQLKPSDRKRLLELQVTLVTELVIDVIGIINRMIEAQDGGMIFNPGGPGTPTIFDPDVQVQVLELAKDIPVAMIPGGFETILEATAAALPCLAPYPDGGVIGKWGYLERALKAKAYLKSLARVMRLESVYRGTKVKNVNGDKRWDLQSVPGVMQMLKKLEEHTADHWQRLFEAAAQPNLSLNDLDISGILGKFSSRSHDIVRWVIGSLLTGSMRTPKDPSRKHVAQRLARDFGLLTRERRTRYVRFGWLVQRT
jgi:hypothetical protein